jgi:hypothetical protein
VFAVAAVTVLISAAQEGLPCSDCMGGARHGSSPETSHQCDCSLLSSAPRQRTMLSASTLKFSVRLAISWQTPAVTGTEPARDEADMHAKPAAHSPEIHRAIGSDSS